MAVAGPRRHGVPRSCGALPGRALPAISRNYTFEATIEQRALAECRCNKYLILPAQGNCTNTEWAARQYPQTNPGWVRAKGMMNLRKLFVLLGPLTFGHGPDADHRMHRTCLFPQHRLGGADVRSERVWLASAETLSVVLSLGGCGCARRRSGCGARSRAW
jgi:hypothetical protein